MIGYMVSIHQEAKMIQLSTGTILKPIPSSPNDDYMAGNDGQIYSRTKYKGFGRKDYVEWYALKGHTSNRGYQTISMCHDNRKVTRTVHRLVCLAFHGTPHSLSLQVRHLDGDPQNNRPGNLCWGTQEENWQDRKEHGRGCEGEKHHASKLTDRERESLRWAIAMGLCSQRHAAKMLGMAQASISSIVHG